MVVTIKRIMFSGDTEMANKCINNKEVKKVPRVKKNIQEDIDYSIKSIKKTTTEIVELKKDLAIATEKKQKETIKFLKRQIVLYKRSKAKEEKEIKKYEKVLKEQD